MNRKIQKFTSSVNFGDVEKTSQTSKIKSCVTTVNGFSLFTIAAKLSIAEVCVVLTMPLTIVALLEKMKISTKDFFSKCE